MGSDNQTLAVIFKEAREKAGLTQAQVAEKAGISANYYARVERNDPTPRIDIVQKIAKALNLKLKLPYLD